MLPSLSKLVVRGIIIIRMWLVLSGLTKTALSLKILTVISRPPNSLWKSPDGNLTEIKFPKFLSHSMVNTFSCCGTVLCSITLPSLVIINKASIFGMFSHRKSASWCCTSSCFWMLLLLCNTLYFYFDILPSKLNNWIFLVNFVYAKIPR